MSRSFCMAAKMPANDVRVQQQLYAGVKSFFPVASGAFFVLILRMGGALCCNAQ